MKPRLWRGVCLVLLVAGALLCGGLGFFCQAKSQPRWSIRKVGRIDLPESRVAVLEDVSSNGLVLLNALYDDYDENPRLVLWDIAKQSFVDEIPYPWQAWQKKTLPLPMQGDRPGPFKFFGSPDRIVGLQGYHVVVITRQSGRWDIQRYLAAPEVADPQSRVLKFSGIIKGAALALDARGEKLAVAFNYGPKPRVFLFDAGADTPYKSWEAERYVEDICWSPDGQRLAVLYSWFSDAGLNLVNTKPPYGNPLPAIGIFDVNTGRCELKFFSGDPQARVSFSQDGALLYSISQEGPYQHMFRFQWTREVIRAFAATDGRLERTFRMRRRGMRGNFAFSPDGKLIVADASTDTWSLFSENTTRTWKEARFILIDVATGKVVFQHEERSPGSVGESMRFAFSHDGRFLFVDPNCAWWGPERVDIYAIEKSP